MRECLICESSESATVWRRAGARIERCLGCGVLFVAGRPAEEELARLYDDETLKGVDFDSAGNGAGSAPRWKLEEQEGILDGLAAMGAARGRLLDIGCYDGFLLANARRRGFEVAGVEPLGKAVEQVREILGAEVHHGTLWTAKPEKESFDAVTLLDVIEHVPDPVAELGEIRRVLRPGGVVAMSTPNAGGLLPWLVGTKRRIAGAAWCPIDNVPWHLWGFTPATIARCVRKAGFEQVRVRQLQPSPKTSNQNGGATAWKKAALRVAAEVSYALGRSDRMVCFACKPAVG